MQVLILGDDHRQQARLAAAMMKTGFQVFCVESSAAASSYIRNELVDVLVLTETRSGRISQSCACVSQSRNRAVSVIVISNRTGLAMDELFEEVPQLYGVMGLDMAPGMVAALALASILPQQIDAEVAPAAAVTQSAATVTGTAHGADQVDAGNAQAIDPASVLAAPALSQALTYWTQPAQAAAAMAAGIRGPLAADPMARQSRTLIEPQRRPVTASPPVKAPASEVRGFDIPSSSAQVAAAASVNVPIRAVAAASVNAPVRPVPPTLRQAVADIDHAPTLPIPITATPGHQSLTTAAPTTPAVLNLVRPDLAAQHNARAAPVDTTDIGLDLAALERELDMVNWDRPSVLAASIADELPSWAHSAPKLAVLTDWTLATPASTDREPGVNSAPGNTVAKANLDRRLALGITLQ